MYTRDEDELRLEVLKERALREKALQERLESFVTFAKIPFQEKKMYKIIFKILENNPNFPNSHAQRREKAEKQLQRVLIVARRALMKTLGGGGRDEELSERVVARLHRRKVK